MSCKICFTKILSKDENKFLKNVVLIHVPGYLGGELSAHVYLDHAHLRRPPLTDLHPVVFLLAGAHRVKVVPRQTVKQERSIVQRSSSNFDLVGLKESLDGQMMLC